MELVVIVIIILIALGGALLHRIPDSSTKGKLGEIEISSILYQLHENDYEVLNNILLENGNNTSEIDHIVISEFGIFVIETKNYSGWIFGNENSDIWTQIIYNSKKTFYNPIKQNHAHVRAIMRILPNIDKRAFISIVAFSQRCRLKKVITETPVIYFHQVVGVIKQHQERLLSVEQRVAVKEVLRNANIYSAESRKSHVKNVREQIKRHTAAIQAGVCPKCGSELTLRHGRYGEFVGCKNYPRCRFKRYV